MIEPQHDVIIVDGAVDHVPALIDPSARDQRLDAIGLFRLFAVDQAAAGRDDPVVVIGHDRRHARRRIDLLIYRRFNAGGEDAVRKRRP